MTKPEVDYINRCIDRLQDYANQLAIENKQDYLTISWRKQRKDCFHKGGSCSFRIVTRKITLILNASNRKTKQQRLSIFVHELLHAIQYIHVFYKNHAYNVYTQELPAYIVGELIKLKLYKIEFFENLESSLIAEINTYGINFGSKNKIHENLAKVEVAIDYSILIEVAKLNDNFKKVLLEFTKLKIESNKEITLEHAQLEQLTLPLERW